MSDLVSLEKAAELLGMSADQLNDMRLKNEIFGTRDGAGWKFKLEEVQRFADDRNISLAPVDMPEDSDFKLTDDSLELSFGSSDAILDDSGESVGEGADIGSAAELSFGSSDISAAGGEDNVLAGEEPDEKGSPSDTGKLLADSAELQLSEDDLFDDEISLEDSASLVDSSDLSSDFEDSDLVLEDSDSSDEPALDLDAAGGVALSANESGISPGDAPVELGGSDIDDLELPDDQDVIALEEPASPDSATLLQSEDNFDLTPLEDSGMDDSSGSQVIALEDSAIYTDDSAPTMLESDDQISVEDSGAPVMLEDSYGQIDPAAQVGGVPETPYSIWNIISLAAALLVVTLGTMVAYDVARNMWQPEDTNLSTTVANMFIEMTGMKP